MGGSSRSTKNSDGRMPEQVKPADVTVPGYFGGRLIKGVTESVGQATKPKKKK